MTKAIKSVATKTRTRQTVAMKKVVRQTVAISVSVEFRALMSADPQKLIAITKKGVGAVIIADLADKFHISAKRFGTMVGLSPATYTRMIREHRRLDLLSSDRAVRYTRLWKQAMELWGSEDGAREWLNAPEQALGGETPLACAETEVGARQVEALMGQIAYGIAT